MPSKRLKTNAIRYGQGTDPLFVKRTYLLALIFVLGSAACGTDTRYSWGHYETSVYRLEVRADDPDTVNESVDLLKEQLELALSQNQPVPPGFHAHLAYLYTLQGRLGDAIGHYRQEKALYPESTQFVDGMLSRLKVSK